MKIVVVVEHEREKRGTKVSCVMSFHLCRRTLPARYVDTLPCVYTIVPHEFRDRSHHVTPRALTVNFRTVVSLVALAEISVSSLCWLLPSDVPAYVSTSITSGSRATKATV